MHSLCISIPYTFYSPNASRLHAILLFPPPFNLSRLRTHSFLIHTTKIQLFETEIIDIYGFKMIIIIIFYYHEVNWTKRIFYLYECRESLILDSFVLSGRYSNIVRLSALCLCFFCRPSKYIAVHRNACDFNRNCDKNSKIFRYIQGVFFFNIFRYRTWRLYDWFWIEKFKLR